MVRLTHIIANEKNESGKRHVKERGGSKWTIVCTPAYSQLRVVDPPPNGHGSNHASLTHGQRALPAFAYTTLLLTLMDADSRDWHRKKAERKRFVETRGQREWRETGVGRARCLAKHHSQTHLGRVHVTCHNDIEHRSHPEN